ncbi:carbohydrate porin [Methylobacterium sp. NEAU 140]|uniref:carbohydrate porin n=1 Tax=Methylobacterium sp. NEAU 140 TaxID=3064945 RepID=UPI002736CC64|nr:carbohydrate porin [Methylobacterium sp. NEAU 140]MDP4022776.1 carbohydrate porin [Methylobacterium sp. NEAU 140]
MRARATIPAVLVLATASLAPAAAADLARPDRAADAPAYTDWSGGYVGLEGSASGSYGAYTFGPTTVGGRPIASFKSGDSTGRSDQGRNATTEVGGGFAGWNWQSGPWVYGVEANLDAANLKRPVPSTVPGFGYETVDPAFNIIRAKTDVYGSLRARLGYSFDSYLVYGAFGLTGANARFLADYPELDADGQRTGGLSRTRRDQSYLGFTLGAGIQYAISDSLALGIDYRYVDLGSSRTFALGSVPDLGPVATRARFTSNQLFLRLLWFPGGLKVPAEPDEAAPHDPDTARSDRFSLHGQTTLIAQGVPGFRSPYVGDQSLIPHQARQTTTATIFLGLKLTDTTEVYYNPEFSQGFGLSRTLGVAGFVNGEAQKAGAPFPKLRSNRYFVKQTINLGGETLDVPDGPNQVATRYDAERITLIAGKFALGDFFDGNVYAHDPRVDFFNWSLWAASAWDFPANLPGFTQGVYAEYNRPEFAIRAAYTQVPKEPSSDVLDPRVFRRAGLNAEFEGRYTLPWLEQPGKLRVGIFSNVGVSANNRDVVTLTQLGLFDDINDAVGATRRPRRKTGGYVNLEQALTPDLGLFARASLNDGRTENISFTDIDQSFSGGLSLKGTAWGRPRDTVGIGAAMNGLSPSHRAAFAAGYYGLLVGDGRLNYGTERAVETYYALGLTKFLTLTFDYQFVDNPGYNRDRGPAHFFASRLHADF